MLYFSAYSQRKGTKYTVLNLLVPAIFNPTWLSDVYYAINYTLIALMAVAALAGESRAIARVLVKDGKVAAYYSMYVVEGEGYVNNLAVAPDRRGKGLGDALMRDMMYAASLSGVTALTLEVRESNAAARSLYEKYGFKPAGVRKNFYPDKENAVIYWLDI